VFLHQSILGPLGVKEEKCNKCKEQGHWASQCDVIHITKKIEKLENKIHDLSKKKKKSKFEVNLVATISTNFDDTNGEEIEEVADFAKVDSLDTAQGISVLELLVFPWELGSSPLAYTGHSWASFS
jgi:predicted transcriptional regulator